MVQARADDVSEEHLRWLIESRSENQKVTLELYLAIKRNEAEIERNFKFTTSAAELAAIAFSLWRAVFLSDLTENVENQMIDLKTFLGTLISHNAIAYQQDRSSREWTFPYYLNNARERLLDLARESPLGLLDVSEIDIEARSAKEDWTIAQNALSKAVERFSQATKSA